MKSENFPVSGTRLAPGEKYELKTRFGGTSRGNAWGKKHLWEGSPEFQWCRKVGGTVILDGPGWYTVGSDDGSVRRAMVKFRVLGKEVAT